MTTDDELTEFTFLTTESLHLVGAPANKFSPLVAKSEAKGRQVNKSLTKALMSAGMATPETGRAVLKSFATALKVAKKTFDKDPSPTNRALLAEAGRRSTLAKLVASEGSRSASVESIRRSQMGLGNRVFSRTNPTPFDVADDRDVDGI